MELSELKIGQWYQATNANEFYYQVLKIGSNKSSSHDSIDVNQLNYKTYYPDTFISNSEYWRKAIEVKYSEIEYLIPEEYRKPEEYLPMIFN